MPHWGDAYYGELYADTVRDLLSPRLSALEADVIARLLGLGPRDRVLDLACGEGRHARVLAPRVASLVGLDRSAAYLKGASPSVRAEGGQTSVAPRSVRGDVRQLPFAAGAFDAAYSWYASLFMFGDAVNEACLRELARVVRPGGRLLVHHANPLRLALTPHDEARRTLPDGGTVEERSDFDARTGVDRSVRRLVRDDGRVVAAVAELRYYSPAEWESLSVVAGLTIVEITTTPHAGQRPPGPIGPDAPDLVVLLEKR